MSYIGSTPTTQNFIAGTDYFNGNGSTVNFTLSRSVNSVNDIEVIVNNVEQIPSGYSVSGTTLTFSAAPSAGTSNVYVRYLSTTNLSLAIPSGTSATFNTVTVADGSATTPSITTTGDTNTGIFFPAADTIAFAEGGAEAARFDASGNFLIGTTTAQTGAKLAVTGGIQGTISSGTTVASTSGTSIDFTSIPSWVKRITVVLQGVSTNGSSAYLARLGTSGGVVTSGYVSSGNQLNPASSSTSSTAGIIFVIDNAGYICTGSLVFNNISSNTWVASYTASLTGVATGSAVGGGQIALGGTLDRVRITTVNGTDTFDAGSINILYEG